MHWHAAAKLHGKNGARFYFSYRNGFVKSTAPHQTVNIGSLGKLWKLAPAILATSIHFWHKLFPFHARQTSNAHFNRSICDAVGCAVIWWGIFVLEFFFPIRVFFFFSSSATYTEYLVSSYTPISFCFVFPWTLDNPLNLNSFSRFNGAESW